LDIETTTGIFHWVLNSRREPGAGQVSGCPVGLYRLV
jgi:hypothetical protein